MSDVGNNKRPIIIKRKKVIAAGHHGGAWKVAYADFVTAMMAFFLLMWLLGATNEKQRKAIADHFNPTITINRNAGGGGNLFGGDSPFPEETLAHNGVGASNPQSSEQQSSDQNQGMHATAQNAAKLQHAQQVLLGSGGESILLDKALKHVLSRLTDEGLVVEIFDLPGEPLFVKETSQPTEIMLEITAMLERVFKLVKNEIALNGHTRAVPIVTITDETWKLSTSRAMEIRKLLEASGIDAKRIQRVTGFSSRKPKSFNPMSVRNNRMELILLRSDL